MNMDLDKNRGVFAYLRDTNGKRSLQPQPIPHRGMAFRGPISKNADRARVYPVCKGRDIERKMNDDERSDGYYINMSRPPKLTIYEDSYLDLGDSYVNGRLYRSIKSRFSWMKGEYFELFLKCDDDLSNLTYDIEKMAKFENIQLIQDYSSEETSTTSPDSDDSYESDVTDTMDLEEDDYPKGFYKIDAIIDEMCKNITAKIQEALKDGCGVCGLSFPDSGNDNITVTSCGHMAHATCLKTWRCTANTCPVCKDCLYYDGECSLCRSDFVESDVISLIKCLHFMHDECLERWSSDHLTCPVCPERLEPIVDRCGVCSESLADSQPKRISMCGHMFHGSCFTFWIPVRGPKKDPTKGSCPICPIKI